MLQEFVREKVPAIALDLFCVFARFEYAMKRGGFRRERSADAAWQTFSQSLPADFFASFENREETKILFEAPPKSLIVSANGSVDWEADPARPIDNSSLFEAVKRVRNNLFHGDKSYDSIRDANLIAAALVVLNLAYEQAENDPKFRAFIGEFGMVY